METSLALHLLQFGVLALVIAALLRRRLPAGLCWLAFGLSVLAIAHGTFTTKQSATDARFFWQAGQDVAQGLNPYERPTILNPPTAFPLYLAFGALPLEGFLLTWHAFNLAGSICLVFLAYQALTPPQAAEMAADGERRGVSPTCTGQTLHTSGLRPDARLPTALLAVVSAAAFLSFANRYGLFLGQLSLLVTLVLVGAVWLQGRGLPLTAGACLALATIKPATMLPFLLLFLRRKDWKTWLSFGVCGCLLAFLTIPPADMPGRLAQCLENIRQAGQPGHVNDYSFENANNRELISFDYALYHLGLRERRPVQLAQLSLLALLGCWVGWQVTRNPRWSRAGCFALVSCYAALFLYHRLYDLLILAVPLVYGVALARAERGATRWWYGCTCLCILGALYLRLALLKEWTAFAQQPGLAPRLVEGLLLPYGTWLTLAALACLAWAERLRAAVPESELVQATVQVQGRPWRYITRTVSDAS